MEQAPWLAFARAQIGVKTFAPGFSNPRITQYHDHTNLKGYDDKASWCSSFVNWALAKVGIEGTGSALARSWLEWGKSLAEPQLGCVVVLSREDPNGWKGQVGFFVRIEAENIVLLGGNQLDEVRENSYPLKSVLGYRWPLNKESLQ
jgi:uncharacterized protein (TIGR02594 family)